MRLALLATLALAPGVACGGDEHKSEQTANASSPASAAPATRAAPGPTIAQQPKDAGTERRLYERLLDSLPSPCGRAQSLRKSMQPSARCVRGGFAARYLERLVLSGHDRDQATVLYEDKYVYRQRHTLALGRAPFVGDPRAPVVLVEFLDYACPFCRRISPWLQSIVSSYPGEVVLYYKMAPIAPQYPHSRHAARAALAAHAQGKHSAMHEALFADPPAHEPKQLRALARSLSLDLRRYARDFAAAKAIVEADLREADAAELSRTPSLFINNQRYTDQLSEAYLRMWIDEELAASGDGR